MKTIKITFIFMMVSMFMLSSCSKEPGFEGQNKIKGIVTYKGSPVANAIVHIAFNKKEVTSEFNSSTATDAGGNFSFSALSKGDYYLEADYTNPSLFKFKSGGAHVTIGTKKEDVTVNLELQ